jgi:antitoxin (DNA-binding transcriptional repressor) of toxin-antitoxin stability system
MFHMRTATVRDLRQNFPKIERWLELGEFVTITKRDKPVALLSLPPAIHKKPTKAEIRVRWSRGPVGPILPGGVLREICEERHRDFEN